MRNFLIEKNFKHIMKNQNDFIHEEEYRNYFSEFNQIIRHSGLNVAIEIFKRADDTNKRSEALKEIMKLLLEEEQDCEELKKLDIIFVETAVEALKIYNDTFEMEKNNE